MFIWTCKTLKEEKNAELVNSLRGSLERFISRESEGLGGHLVNEVAEEHTDREDNVEEHTDGNVVVDNLGHD
ncbi:hypothetical protein RchiOBHm_Chr4g0427821 [Rosa chinensis]|uniref:Uncharacterized protein n=1 Tax=Rosa chinensis TaxID=74649 RepID=A0A2P6QZQ9_ROSCH|nr:hypothetical protein RchiOBHm_Chr4g0427821 [Rosa chinensis]